MRWLKSFGHMSSTSQVSIILLGTGIGSAGLFLVFGRLDFGWVLIFALFFAEHLIWSSLGKQTESPRLSREAQWFLGIMGVISGAAIALPFLIMALWPGKSSDAAIVATIFYLKAVITTVIVLGSAPDRLFKKLFPKRKWYDQRSNTFSS